MKTLSILLLVVSGAWAQTQAPLKITIHDTHADATNIGSKEIVLVVVNLSKKDNPDHVYAHDYFFKPGGMPPGDTEEIIHPEDAPITNVQLLMVQYADGSTWGQVPGALDRGEGAMTMKDVADSRASLLPFYKNAIAAYNQQGEQGFLTFLSNVPKEDGDAKGAAIRFLRVQKQSGTAAAVDMIQQRLTAGLSRHF